MENQRLIEIRSNLDTLPVLQNRLERLNHSISEAEDRVQELLGRLEEESLDVDNIKKESLSTTLLKFIGKYEGKLNKETQEMLTAKLEYDKAAQRVKELYTERDELVSRISMLNADKRVYEDELKKRDDILMHNFTEEIAVKYRHLEEERDTLSALLIETTEAQRAANRVKNTASSAMQHLESAENWATYDVWVKGGIFSHVAKYDHIDNAQSEFNRLASQLGDLKKELSDIELFDTFEFSEIDTGTRVMDFWFDNIFTDLNVRDKIRDDMEQLNSLYSSIVSIINKLENNKIDIQRKINNIEQKKIDLAISLNVSDNR